MSLKESVVIIDANRAIETGGIPVLERHAEYGKQLLGMSQGQTHLVVIGSRKLLEIASGNPDANLIVLGPKSGPLNRMLLWLTVDQILKDHSISPKLFVVGDPWKSALVGKVLRSRYYKNVPFQLQIHADFCAPKWKFQNFRYFLKFIVARYTLSQYRNLRLVSKSQKRNMKLGTSYFVDIIPVKFSSSPLNLMIEKKQKPLTFGFFGRLHKDRGTAHLIRIFKRILSEDNEIKLVIGGDGPEMSRIQKQLKLRFPSQISMMGYVHENEADAFWQDIDVLISLAPFESYGRVLRESLLKSRPVLTFSSSGAIDLLESAGDSWVKFIDPKDPPYKILEKARALTDMGLRQDLPVELTNPIDSSKLMARSWLTIIG